MQFLVFKLQPGEKEHAYSIVTKRLRKKISDDIVLHEKEVTSKNYLAVELERMRDELVKGAA